MSPQALEGRQAPVTLIKQWKRQRGEGWGKNRRFLAQSDIAGHGATLALFVVNFIKLHLTTVIMSMLGLNYNH